RAVEGGPSALRALTLVVQLSVLASYNALQAQCPDGSPPPCRLTSHASTAPAPNSVAVLYFDNLSPDTADAYLADGLTEELIGRLGQLQRLAVKSRAAVQRFRKSGVDPLAAARALRIAQLVTGSVRRAGDRLRVTVELVRASDGEHMWGESYDRRDADLLVVEADIAGAVAAAISGRLMPGERAVAQDSANSEAWHARAEMLSYDYPQTLDSAIRAYHRALTLDPRNAQAMHDYSLMLQWVGDDSGAIAGYHRTLALEPNRPVT